MTTFEGIAHTAFAFLQEAKDLVPRISEDDPMAPALADWMKRVKDLMAEVDEMNLRENDRIERTMGRFTP